MEKKVKVFLNEVKDDKKKNLMGIELDISYWNKIIGNDDEPKLRLSLEEENKKLIKGRGNKVVKDNRDIEKIAILSTRIEVIKSANDELVKLRGMKSSIHDYFSYISKISKETQKALDVIAKM